MCAIMGDLHLEPGHQMPLFEEARRQLVAAVTAPDVAAPRVVQLGEARPWAGHLGRLRGVWPGSSVLGGSTAPEAPKGAV